MRPSRRSFLLASALASLGRSQDRRPNVLIILADDQGWGDVAGNGNNNLRTPNIDSIGRNGATFDRFFVCPVCAPTRAEFLTGRYHPRGGVRGVSTGAERLNTDEVTIADVFRAAGYATGAFGKWHNGTQAPYDPNSRGFDEFYGFTSGHWGHYFEADLEHNGKLVRGRGYLADDLTNHAIAFVKSNRSRPFFCYLPLNTPHSPMQVPDRYYDRFANAEIRQRGPDGDKEDVAMTRAALAMCENIDANVGRALQALKDAGVYNDTIVIYFSDNGPNSWRWNGGMRGRKGSVDEGGLRVPFVIQWPGQIKAGLRVSRIAGAIDLLPTLADLAAVPLKAGKPLDGRSLKPLLLGETAEWPDRMIFSTHNGRVSVRTQQYRLDAEGRLYDMTEDPGQERDIAGDKPAVAAKLRTAVAEWRRDVLANVGKDDRPFPVGHRPVTLLPARDGVGEGGIQRSSRHPNCSFFTHWSSREDRIMWDVAIARAGLYEAELHYTCSAADKGSLVELSFRDASVRQRITEAHDPPLIGQKHDRVPRTESYVKSFRPLRLGSIRLAEGRGKLTLRALEIPARNVADVRYLVLTRKDG